jgi:hypothetical protein
MTTKRLRDPAIIAALLRRVLRRCALAALTDGRWPGAFTREARVSGRQADASEVWV